MCGLAFSGKSTLARKLAKHTGSKLIAFDNVWVEKDKEKPVPKNAEGWRYIRDIAQHEIITTLKKGTSVLYDDNNPRKEHREELRNIAREAGAAAIVVYLDTPLNIIKAREEMNRVSQERHEVEPHNFQKVMQDLEVPTADENTVVFTQNMDIDSFLEKLDTYGKE
jgi:predicted kinase